MNCTTDNNFASLPVPSSSCRMKTGCVLLVSALVCLALSPGTQAASPSPAPDGGYANNTTAEGDGALHSLDTGTDNTALGFNTLYQNTTGGFNTATGSYALHYNTTA